MSVLVIEDNSEAGEALVGYLGKNGIKARWSSTCQDARNKMATKLPTVILLDLMLEKGEKVQDFVDEKLVPHKNMIVLTAADENVINNFQKEYPDIICLQKPANPQTILEIVTKKLKS